MVRKLNGSNDVERKRVYIINQEIANEVQGNMNRTMVAKGLQ